MEQIEPKHVDIPYGPHFRNTLNFWQAETAETAETKKPSPLLIWIHGGGFWCGSKRWVPPHLLDGALKAGISVASINYRLSQQAPFPAPMLDGARAVQFLRYHARELQVDPDRISAAGSSAGGGISLWVGFHEDLADPTSEDLIARQSTRLFCMTCTDTQSSYDPNYIGKLLNKNGALAEKALETLFRVSPDRFQTPAAKKLFAEGSAITHAKAGAPPTLMFHARRDIPPTAEMDAAYAIHHPVFGRVLKEKLDSLGVECVVKTRDDYPDRSDEQMGETFAEEALQFLGRQLGQAETT